MARSLFLILTLVVALAAVVTVGAAQQDVEVPVQDVGAIEQHPMDAVGSDDPVLAAASDGRMKRHRPLLAGLLIASALRRPHYGGYGGGYGGYGYYPSYYGGYGGYGGHYYG